MKLPIFGNIWVRVSHDACGAMLKDQVTFVRDPANAGKHMLAHILKMLPRSMSLLALNMLGHDDPEHRHLRGLVDQAFQRRGIQAIRPMIIEVADRLLDQMQRRRQVDLMDAFCRDLPLSVICAMLGLPERDHQRFKNWLGGLKDTANIGAVIRAVPGVLKVVRYLRDVSRPGGGAKPDGLVVALRDAEVDGRRLSEDELVSMIFLLFGALFLMSSSEILYSLSACLSEKQYSLSPPRAYRRSGLCSNSAARPRWWVFVQVWSRRRRGDVDGKRASCEVYARIAVVQAEAASRFRCGLRGPAWVADAKPHFQWCRYVPRRKIAEEQLSRADELQRCFDKLGDFDDDDRGRRR